MENGKIVLPIWMFVLVIAAFFFAGFACFVATVLFVYLLTFKPKFSINAPSEAL